MSSQEKSKKEKSISSEMPRLSPGAHALAAIGNEVEKVVIKYFADKNLSFFNVIDQETLKKLADAFRNGWSDIEAAKVVEKFIEITEQRRTIEISSLCRWILSHQNDASSVLDCISIDPPSEINIVKLLSRAGSQKLVFQATWRLTQSQVVLKHLIGPPEKTKIIFDRESQAHPLSMGHSNIIKTHFLKNAAQEPFLVEERLNTILDDQWRSRGIQEAANLLFDIANALNYLHQSLFLVHGDVKPDNIGKKNENYILLDFGICRPANSFTYEASATGSLRTRAPELLKEEPGPYKLPYKVDIWALGATVYNALVGRFPLFNFDEKPPRISKPEERKDYEKILLNRADNEWGTWVKIDSEIKEPSMRKILAMALEKDPNARCSAEELMKTTEKELSAFLRKSLDDGRFSPFDEIEQLNKYLPESDILKLMPIGEKQALKERIMKLNEKHNLEVKNILSKIG